MAKFAATIKKHDITVIVSVMVLITFVTVVSLPQIDLTEPDPYFHVKATPIAYWIGFLICLVIAGVCSFLSLKKNMTKNLKLFGFLSLLGLMVYIYVFPRLMYVNKIYVDTYLFLGETLHVLRYGVVGFGWATETPGLSVFSAQLSLVSGINYITIADFLPQILPFIFIIVLYVLSRYTVKGYALLACLIFVAFNWLGFVFNRQSFSTVLQLFTWYLVIRMLLKKDIDLRLFLLAFLSYISLVVSHPASPFALTLNMLGVAIFALLVNFRARFRSRAVDDQKDAGRRLYIRTMPIALFFLIIWIAWQVYVGGALFSAISNAFYALYEMVASPSPVSQLGGVISGYTSNYNPIVLLRLFVVMVVVAMGVIFAFLAVLKKSNLKNLVISAWFLSTAALNVYVLYSHSWIERPFLYSLPAFSILSAIFLHSLNHNSTKQNRTLNYNPSKQNRIIRGFGVAFLGLVILLVSLNPLIMYSHNPIAFPPTSYLKELDFVTKYGERTVIIFGGGAEVGYYILLNNASIDLWSEEALYDANLNFSMEKMYNVSLLCSSFRVFTKEAFVQVDSSVKEIFDSPQSIKPGFTRIYDATSWHMVYMNQINHSKSVG